jgi:hypothetical protein
MKFYAMKAYAKVDAYIHDFYTPLFVVFGQLQVSFALTPGEAFRMLNYIITVVDVWIHVFLTPVLFGELSPTGLGRFTPGEICSHV